MSKKNSSNEPKNSSNEQKNSSNEQKNSLNRQKNCSNKPKIVQMSKKKHTNLNTISIQCAVQL